MKNISKKIGSRVTVDDLRIEGGRFSQQDQMLHDSLYLPLVQQGWTRIGVLVLSVHQYICDPDNSKMPRLG